ncbi:MAG: hypothetical protein IT186_08725 [Acidobacteria bacterium]|nr:hypothetical protein [Acidobacteriota bacterium]
MRRLLLLPAIVLGLTLVAPAAAGASVKTWKNPEAGQRTFKKMGVFVLMVEQPVRRTAELMFASTAKGETEVIPSHTFVSDDEYKNRDAVVAKVKEGGFDSIVVFRINSSFETTESTTKAALPGVMGANYAYFSTAYGFSLNDMGPLTQSVDRVVQIETLVYAASDQKLVWTGTERMKSPTPTFDSLGSVIEKAVKAMRKDKLIR